MRQIALSLFGLATAAVVGVILLSIRHDRLEMRVQELEKKMEAKDGNPFKFAPGSVVGLGLPGDKESIKAYVQSVRLFVGGFREYFCVWWAGNERKGEWVTEDEVYKWEGK